MPAPGELKRRKKTKNPLRWIKEKIIDPVMKKLKPHIQNFLKTKFGSSMKKFAHWINESVIQQDKYGLMNAIKSVVPGGVYLDQALKIAGNLFEKADYDAVGQFIEQLVYRSDNQESVINSFESMHQKQQHENNQRVQKETKERPQPAIQRNVTVLNEPFKIPPMRAPIVGENLKQKIEDDAEENEEEDDSPAGKNQRLRQNIFGKPIN